MSRILPRMDFSLMRSCLCPSPPTSLPPQPQPPRRGFEIRYIRVEGQRVQVSSDELVIPEFAAVPDALKAQEMIASSQADVLIYLDGRVAAEPERESKSAAARTIIDQLVNIKIGRNLIFLDEANDGL